MAAQGSWKQLFFIWMRHCENKRTKFKLPPFIHQQRCKWLRIPHYTWRLFLYTKSGLILGLCPANERHRCKVTLSLIGWAQTYNQPWECLIIRSYQFLKHLVALLWVHWLLQNLTGSSAAQLWRSRSHFKWHINCNTQNYSLQTLWCFIKRRFMWY